MGNESDMNAHVIGVESAFLRSTTCCGERGEH
jgi:hypothetical protein